MKKRNKIALIGSGQIGGVLALLAGMRNLGDVVLYDVVTDLPQGKALDISHLAPVFNADFNILGTNNIEDIKDSDVCIVTSGIPRKPGMSRDDLIKTNAGIIKSVGENIKKYAPQAFVVVITNPLDAMAYMMQKVTGFPAERVVGMAGVLDSSRYRAFLSKELGVSVASITACVLGGHGDTMVPVRSYTTVNGVPVEKFLDSDTLTRIEERVKNAGGEIVALLKTGSAFNSPAAAAIQMAESYLYDKKEILPCAVLCQGEYGANNLYLGVPVQIGSKGVEKIIELKLTNSEQELLKKSIAAVADLTQSLPL